MSLADAILAARREGRDRRRGVSPLPAPEPSIGSKILGGLLSGLEPVGALFESVDAPTRALLARAMNAVGPNLPGAEQFYKRIEPTGRETMFGRAASGRELLGLDRGEIGKFESGDPFGFGVEAVLSPWNLLGVGALTKAGKAGARVKKLARIVESYEMLPEAARALSKTSYEASKTKLAQLLAKGAQPTAATLRQQGRLGERSLLSFDLPGVDVNMSLPIVGGRLASEYGLGALGAIGRGVRTAVGPLRPMFRLAGNLPGEQIIRRIHPTTGEVIEMPANRWNELVRRDVELGRIFKGKGQEEGQFLAKALGDLDKGAMEGARESLIATLGPQIEEAIALSYPVQRAEQRLAEAIKLSQAEPIGLKVGTLIRPPDRPNFGRIISINEDAKTAVVRFVNKKEGTKETLTFPLADLVAAKQREISPEGLKALEIRLTSARDRVRRKVDIRLGIARVGAAQGMFDIGATHGVAVERLGRLQERIVDEATAKIQGLQKRAQGAFAAGHEGRGMLLLGAADRATTVLETQVADLGRRQQLSNAIYKALPKEIQERLAKYELLTDETLKLGQQVGERIMELQDLGIAYLYRAVNPAAVQVQRQLHDHGITGWATEFYRRYSATQGYAKRRIKAFEGMGNLQINDMWEQYVLKLKAAGVPVDLPGGKVPALLIEDPSEIVMRRIANEGSGAGSASLMSATAETFAIPKAFRRADDMSTAEFLARSRLGAFQGKVLPKSVKAIEEQLAGTRFADTFIPQEFVKQALSIRRVAHVPEEMEAFAGWMGKYLAMMRYSVTTLAVTVPGIKRLGWMPAAGIGATIGGLLGGPVGAGVGGAFGALGAKFGVMPFFPTFHVRNALSNGFMMWLADWRDLSTLQAGRKAINRYGEIVHAAGATAEQLAKDPDASMVQLARSLGAYGGTMPEDIAYQLTQAGAPQARLGKALAPIVAPTTTKTGQQAIALGTYIENVSKMALFIDGIKNKGLTPIEAADRVKKFLFDYSELSQFEKRYLRKWAFFYTWTRKAFPLMWEQTATQPAKMRLFMMATGQVGDDTAQKKYLRDYQQSQMPFFGGQGKSPGERLFWDLGLPPTQLSMLSTEGKPGAAGIQRVLQKAMAMGQPFFREPIEFATGMGLQSGQPTTAGRALMSLTPAARLWQNLKMSGEIAAGKRPGYETTRMLAATPITVDAAKARNQQSLDQLLSFFENERMMGRMRTWRGYAPATEALRTRYAPYLAERRRLEEALKSGR